MGFEKGDFIFTARLISWVALRDCASLNVMRKLGKDIDVLTA